MGGRNWLGLLLLNHSPREVQIAALEQQLQWAVDYRLPVSFHVREAYEDFYRFWLILAVLVVFYIVLQILRPMQIGHSNRGYI